MIAVSEASKDEVKKMLRRFTMGRRAILIISYETFRIHEKLFKHGNECGLLICDEAHRLKNKETKTAQALNNLATRRRRSSPCRQTTARPATSSRAASRRRRRAS